MSAANSRANRRRSNPAVVEHVSAHQTARLGLFVRIIGIGRAKVKIGMVNPAYNFSRYVCVGLEARPHDAEAGGRNRRFERTRAPGARGG